MKQKHYKTLLLRMKASEQANYYLESIWYAYAVIEDRLVSALKQSGGHLKNNGQPIKMLGPKIQKINSRKPNDKLLRVTFDGELMDRLDIWKEKRNDLMHQMADASSDFKEIDKVKYLVAKDGAKLARDFCTVARRLKKNRNK